VGSLFVAQISALVLLPIRLEFDADLDIPPDDYGVGLRVGEVLYSEVDLRVRLVDVPDYGLSGGRLRRSTVRVGTAVAACRTEGQMAYQAEDGQGQDTESFAPDASFA
jgi:hypothetical protein